MTQSNVWRGQDKSFPRSTMSISNSVHPGWETLEAIEELETEDSKLLPRPYMAGRFHIGKASCNKNAIFLGFEQANRHTNKIRALFADVGNMASRDEIGFVFVQPGAVVSPQIEVVPIGLYTTAEGRTYAVYATPNIKLPNDLRPKG